jgi:hypothetical protein
MHSALAETVRWHDRRHNFVPRAGKPAHIDPVHGAPLDAELADALFAPRVARCPERDDYDLDAAGRLHWRGPRYPDLPRLAPWRALAASRELAADEARAYGAAVRREIHALNQPKRRSPERAWRWRPTTAAQLAAIERRENRSINGELRTPEWWREHYEKAMQEKRTALQLRALVATVVGRDWRALLKSPSAAIEVANDDEDRMDIRLAEAERARAWREAQGLSRAELAERSGFSASQIQDYEEGARRGKSGEAAVISEAAWRRYRLACAAIAAGLPDAW